ncbi:four-helix bundle copper-binding protein [Aneurinibacillus sp. Ricciae_BoGa-3]|uniref:four-helix bundle copper-binding protein n=1 Tax=Aneurinibacillus sp. Ricciae_BoGa-3 TaxID=3022697 RepID=UPI002341DFE3|nr:four-helix bundle copper-binding protein [Aneurinibacillus sp. Ricciae_BoGa-3]WCK52927.1 four-helix bundle copper-binding protein [Aneurinibacillus sp. Ricciae_BoGa-3]
MEDMYMMGGFIYKMFPVLRTIQHCASHCEHMGKMFLHSPDVYARTTQIDLLRDCADICDSTARYIARNSMFSKSLAKKCARICETCGTYCLQFPDEASQLCARVCLHCAAECRAFVMGVGSADPNWE